jgi:hypothetical protein
MRPLALLLALIAGLTLSAVALGSNSGNSADTTSTGTSTSTTTTGGPTTIGTQPPPAPTAGYCPETLPPGAAKPAQCRRLPHISSKARRINLLVSGPVQSTQTEPNGTDTLVRFSMNRLFGRAHKLLRRIGGEASIADVPAKLKIIGPDGSAMDAGQLSDAAKVRVRGRMVDPRKWVIGDEGTALPTMRVHRLQVVTMNGDSSGGGDASGDCVVDGTCSDSSTEVCPDDICSTSDVSTLPEDGSTDSTPVSYLVNFYGFVERVDQGSGTITVKVAWVDGLPNDQERSDFRAKDVTFTTNADTTYDVAPDRNPNGVGDLGDIAPESAPGKLDGDSVRVDVVTSDRLPLDQSITASAITNH